MRRAVASTLLLGHLLLIGQVASAAPAAPAASAADAPAGDSKDATSALCHDSSVPCSVQAPAAWTEGERHEVAVTGNPDVTVRLRAHRLVSRGGSISYVPLGKRVTMITDSRGFAHADLTLPRLATGTPGGPVLLAPDGADLSDPTRVLGTWVNLASRTPRLVGDGYAARKPVGKDLTMQVEHAVGGTSFDVELRDRGTWTSIGTTRTRTCQVVESCSVGYRVPRGLDPRRYRVRLVNLTTGTPVGEWTVRPSARGTTRPRDPGSRVPVVGGAVAGALASGSLPQPVRKGRAENLTLPEGAVLAGSGTGTDRWGASHPSVGVRVAALTLGAAALLAALVLLRRRRA